MIQYFYTFDPETRELTPSGDPVNVKNDTNVVQIVFTMPASYEGLALSSYVWRVFYKIAMNTKVEEVRFHQFTNPTTEGENLVLTWTVTNSVTEFAGHLGFALSGTLTDTGGNVTNRINSIPAYERIEPTIGGGSYTEDDAEIEGIKDFLVGIQEAAEAAQAAAETAAAEAEASAARAEQIADELEPYKSLAIVESASGDPATFTDGSNGVPMKSVSVDIDPVQDLNGYEYPWVGGAGKNLLPTIKSATGITPMNATFVSDDDTGTLKVTSTSATTAQFVQVYYTVHPNISIGDTVTFSVSDVTATRPDWMIFIGSSISSVYSSLNNSVRSTTFTVADTTDIVLTFRVSQYRNNAIGDILEVKGIQLEKGSTATSFAPYSNICPISGWDEVKVTRTGKNLLPMELDNMKSINTRGTWSGNAYTYGGVTFTVETDSDGNVTGISTNGTAQIQTGITLCQNAFLKSGAYKFSGTASGSGWSTSWQNAMVGGTTNYNDTGSGVNITASDDTTITAYCYVARGATISNKVFYPLLRDSSDTDAAFEPYAGQTYPISLTSAGTVYGGTLDAATGELVVDRAYLASYNGETLPSTWISDRDKYTEGAIPTIGAQVVYKLATPLTYTLTPTQITSLLGVNHVWADCGEVAVEYVADTKMYIDKIVASL